MNELKEKLKNGEKILGTLVCLTDPCLCEIMGNIGYSCVWIDTEHTYMSHKEVLCHLNAARSAGIPSVVRLPQNDLTDKQLHQYPNSPKSSKIAVFRRCRS